MSFEKLVRSLYGHPNAQKSVELIVTAGSVEQRKAWLETVCILVAPWRLLFIRFKQRLGKQLPEHVLRTTVLTGRKTESTSEQSPTVSLYGLSRGVERIATVPLINVRYITESDVEVQRCVNNLRAAVYVVFVLTRVIVEMEGDGLELSRISADAAELRRNIVLLMAYVLHPNGIVPELHFKKFFEVQEILVDVLYSFESLWMSPIEEARSTWNNLTRRVINVILSTKMTDSLFRFLPELRDVLLNRRARRFLEAETLFEIEETVFVVKDVF